MQVPNHRGNSRSQRSAKCPTFSVCFLLPKYFLLKGLQSFQPRTGKELECRVTVLSLMVHRHYICCLRPPLSNADFYPLLQPPLIQQYLDANGIIMGKTNLAEMQDTITSIQPSNLEYGINTPLNPYDPTRIAGGRPRTLFKTPRRFY